MRIESTKIKPLGDKILIKIKREESKTATGIILTTKTPEKTDFGEVIATGTETDFKTGSIVLYDKFSGIPLDDDLIMISEDDVLAIYEE